MVWGALHSVVYTHLFLAEAPDHQVPAEELERILAAAERWSFLADDDVESVLRDVGDRYAQGDRGKHFLHCVRHLVDELDTPLSRFQLWQDLMALAQADGVVTPAEAALLERVRELWFDDLGLAAA